MTLDGFITFLGLLAAVYTLVPQETRLRARFAGALQAMVALSAVTLVLYFQFFDLWGQPCSPLLGSLCERLVIEQGGRFSAQDAAFFVVLGWIFVALGIHRFVRPGSDALPALAKLVDQLHYERRYADLLKVVEPLLPLVGAGSRRRLRFQQLHDKLLGWRDRKTGIVGLFGKEREPEPPKHVAFLQRLVGHLAPLIPAQRNAERSGRNVARVLYESEPLRAFMAQERPYFAMDLLAAAPWGGMDFSDQFLKLLVRDQNSVLYQELRQTTVLDWGTSAFRIEPSSRLLTFLFADAKVAERYQVWKPIGDHMLEQLRSSADNEYLSKLNRPIVGDFDDVERWHDPVANGIYFFDVMIRAAASQGVTNHMWLPYMHLVAERLVASYDPSHDDVDQDDEFPTLGSRLLYEALDALGHWVELAIKLPADNPNTRVPEPSKEPQATIPVTAANSLGRSIAAVAHEDNKLGDLKAGYFHEMVMTDIKHIGEQPNGAAMQRYLIGAVLRGGGSPNVKQEYLRRLADLYLVADEMLQLDVRDYGVALRVINP
jgi:hypothetical protein